MVPESGAKPITEGEVEGEGRGSSCDGYGRDSDAHRLEYVLLDDIERILCQLSRSCSASSDAVLGRTRRAITLCGVFTERSKPTGAWWAAGRAGGTSNAVRASASEAWHLQW